MERELKTENYKLKTLKHVIPAQRLQPVDDIFDPLCLVFRYDQHGVGRGHHNQVVNPHHRQHRSGADEDVAGGADGCGSAAGSGRRARRR